MPDVTLADLTLVAIAAGSIFTAWMAISTKRLAEGTQDEIAAQWTPILLAVRVPREYDLRSLDDLSSSPRWDGRDFLVTVRNFGRGPALDAYADLGEGTKSGLGTIPDGELGTFRFKQPIATLIDSELPVTVSFYYSNLNGDVLASYAIIQTVQTLEDYWVAATSYTGSTSVMDALTRWQRLARHFPEPIRRHL